MISSTPAIRRSYILGNPERMYSLVRRKPLRMPKRKSLRIRIQPPFGPFVVEPLAVGFQHAQRPLAVQGSFERSKELPWVIERLWLQGTWWLDDWAPPVYVCFLSAALWNMFKEKQTNKQQTNTLLKITCSCRWMEAVFCISHSTML